MAPSDYEWVVPLAVQVIGGEDTEFYLKGVGGPAGYEHAVQIECRLGGCGWGLFVGEIELWDFIADAREHWETTHAKTPAPPGHAPVPATRWRVLYTASRAVTDWQAVWRDLDAILADHPQILLRTGACPEGGDQFACEWFQQRRTEGHDVIYDPRPAPWKQFGKAAGPMRNAYMVGLGADECMAHIHPDGSGGARGCADFAEWAGIPTRRVEVT